MHLQFVLAAELRQVFHAGLAKQHRRENEAGNNKDDAPHGHELVEIVGGRCDVHDLCYLESSLVNWAFTSEIACNVTLRTACDSGEQSTLFRAWLELFR